MSNDKKSVRPPPGSAVWEKIAQLSRRIYGNNHSHLALGRSHPAQTQPALVTIPIRMKSVCFLHRPSLSKLLCGAALLHFTLASAHAQTPGDEDTSFAVGPIAGGSLQALALQPNGQVLVGGGFTTFRGANRSAVARLNADGTLDGFDPGLAITGYNGSTPAVYALGLQANGQVIAAGTFNVLGQTPGGGVARLNADGSLDATFNAGSGVLDAGGIVGHAEAVVALPNGQVLVGGTFVSFDGARVHGLVRLNPDGSVDATFNPGGAGVSYNGGTAADVKAIVVQPDGRILVGGSFAAYDGVAAGDIVRLNADGTIDPTFQAGAAVPFDSADFQSVEALALQPDGQILVGGTFHTFDGASVPHLVRLRTDGSLDLNYYPANGVTLSEVASIIAQPDGSALVGGQVYIPQGLIYSPGDGLALINADGSQNTGFDYGDSALRVTALVLQPDGKALIAANNNGLANGAAGDAVRVYDLTIATTATIVAGAAKVSENGSAGPATFVVSLNTAPSAKTVVKYTLGGSAAPGTDYQPLSGKAKIKPGHTSATISVSPIDRGIGGGGKVTVKAILQAGKGYEVGGPSTAKVKILDND